ncbi:MAG TPA: 3'(2'),5'-bisphosphate nucleotidase CysQ, partial [Rhodanobacteraceae bacterium]|nr:3'(2'),5'-bisphosphate nucleotidase CysQ [Rhodanobacteraceae bacterium]
MSTLENLLPDVGSIARAAGAAILDIYAGSFAVERKDDDSPLTAADLAAHRVILDGLAVRTPGWPVLSEESASEIAVSERRSWSRYWLVDPLDGTREFVKRNGEFTVNIALIEGGEAVLGVVLAPVTGELFAACRGAGAYIEARAHAIPEALSVSAPATPLRIA